MYSVKDQIQVCNIIQKRFYKNMNQHQVNMGLNDPQMLSSSHTRYRSQMSSGGQGVEFNPRQIAMAQMNEKFEKMNRQQVANDLMPKSPRLKIDKVPVKKKFQNPLFSESKSKAGSPGKNLSPKNKSPRFQTSHKKKKMDFSIKMADGPGQNKRNIQEFYHPAFEQFNEANPPLTKIMDKRAREQSR